jgi:hypothetical protein
MARLSSCRVATLSAAARASFCRLTLDDIPVTPITDVDRIARQKSAINDSTSVKPAIKFFEELS